MNWHICHKRKLIFLFVFSTYLHVFLLKFQWEISLDVEFNFASNEYQHCILLTKLAAPKTRNTWKMWWWCNHHIFSCISYFWGSGVCQNHVVCALVGCKIKFRIQWALPFRIWVKTQGDMSKIRTKSSFFHSSSKINNYYFIIFLKRPILDLKFPLIRKPYNLRPT